MKCRKAEAWRHIDKNLEGSKQRQISNMYFSYYSIYQIKPLDPRIKSCENLMYRMPDAYIKQKTLKDNSLKGLKNYALKHMKLFYLTNLKSNCRHSRHGMNEGLGLTDAT